MKDEVKLVGCRGQGVFMEEMDSLWRPPGKKVKGVRLK